MLLRLYHHWRDSYIGIPTTIWFLSIVSLINRCGGMVVAFMTVYLTQHLHYGIKEAGYVMGAFGVGALLGAWLGGKLTDRFGYYSIQLWSLILNGLMLLLVMTLEDFWAMMAAIFFLSLVSEIFRPANSVAISVHSTPETRTRSISLYRMAVNLGWTVAPAAGGLLAAIGWNWLFIVDGLTCILAAGLLLLLIKPVRPEHKPEEEGAPAPLPAAVSPYRDQAFLIFAVLTVLNAIVFMQLLWTVPVFFKEIYHWNEARIGLTAAINGFIVFLLEMPLIYRIDGRRPPMTFIRMGLVMYALAYALFLMPTSTGLVPAILFMVAISFGEMYVMPFSTNFVFARARENGNQGQYMALYTMSYSLANIIAPLLGTQIIAAFGFDVFWVVLGGISALSWIGFWWLERRMKEPGIRTLSVESVEGLK